MKKSTLAFKETGFYNHNLKSGEWIRYERPILSRNSRSFNAKVSRGSYSQDVKVGIWETYFERGCVVKRYDFDRDSALTTTVYTQCRYPASARKNGIEGIVSVRAIYQDCEPIQYEIVTDIGYGCPNELIESLKRKRELEKKYGVGNKRCEVSDEILTATFRLNE